MRGLFRDFHLRHTHGTFYYQKREGTPAAKTDLPRRVRLVSPIHPSPDGNRAPSAGDGSPLRLRAVMDRAHSTILGANRDSDVSPVPSASSSRRTAVTQGPSRESARLTLDRRRGSMRGTGRRQSLDRSEDCRMSSIHDSRRPRGDRVAGARARLPSGDGWSWRDPNRRPSAGRSVFAAGRPFAFLIVEGPVRVTKVKSPERGRAWSRRTKEQEAARTRLRASRTTTSCAVSGASTSARFDRRRRRTLRGARGRSSATKIPLSNVTDARNAALQRPARAVRAESSGLDSRRVSRSAHGE